MRRVAALGILLGLVNPAWADPPPEPATEALATLITVGREQVALARVGVARGTRRAVRAYAGRVVDDVRQEERRITSTVDVTAPRQRRDVAVAVRALRAVPRDSFDVAFLAAMEVRHRRAVAIATSALTMSDASVARDLLARLVPVLRQQHDLERLVEASS